jgi:hypothetical protein
VRNSIGKGTEGMEKGGVGEARVGRGTRGHPRRRPVELEEERRQGSWGSIWGSSGREEVRVRRKEEAGRAYNRGTVDALPRHGIYCLAAERGKRGLGYGDNEKSWDCARGLREAMLGR